MSKVNKSSISPPKNQPVNPPAKVHSQSFRPMPSQLLPNPLPPPQRTPLRLLLQNPNSTARPMPRAESARKKSTLSSTPSTFSTLTREGLSTSKVLLILLRTQSGHDFPGILVQKRSHLPNDRRPGRRRQRDHRFWLMVGTHDQASQRQGLKSQCQQNLRLVRRRENRLHLNQKFEEDRPGTWGEHQRGRTARTHYPR